MQDYDVGIVTEIKNKVNENCKIPDFNVIIKSSQRIGIIAAGGMAMMVERILR